MESHQHQLLVMKHGNSLTMESGGGSIAKLINVVGGSQRQDLMTMEQLG